MKIVQKFLSHGLLIATLVAVFFIYLYRGELFPQWFDKQAQTEETPAQSTVTQTPAVSAGVPQPAQASGTEDEGQADRPVPTEPVAEAVEQAVATQPLSAAAPVAAPAQSEAPTADVPAVAEQPAEEGAQTADTATAAQYRPVGAEEAAPAAAEAGAAGDAEFQSQLEQARQHYWRHDMHAAEQAYRRLTESHPQRAEVWGELGNLYFSQREMVQATDAYYQAVELLIEQGDAERARQMLGAMYQLDAGKAKQLEARLGQGGS